jgi:multicomponent Na+:H+ antiporter subunit E
MNFFLLNLLLAATWALLYGEVTVSSLVVGFFLGFNALWFTQPLFGGGKAPYFLRVWRSIRLFLFFLWELVIGSVDVLKDILTPRQLSNPCLVEMPLDVKSDAEILLVTNLISLTPGTLSVEVSEDRKTLLVHAMFADDPDALVRSLKNGMERMVREVFE